MDPHLLIERLDATLRNDPRGDIVELRPGQFSITPRLARIHELADEDSRRMNDEYISTEHLFLEIFEEHDTPSSRLLQETGLTRARVSEAILQMRG